MQKHPFRRRSIVITALICVALLVVILVSGDQNFSSKLAAQEQLHQLCQQQTPVLEVEGLDESEESPKMADLFDFSPSVIEESSSPACMIELIDGANPPSTHTISEVEGLRTYDISTNQVQARFRMVYILDEEVGDNKAYVISRFVYQ